MIIILIWETALALTKDNGSMANGMEKESIISLMGVYIKAILRMVKDVAMEYSTGQIKVPMKESGRMDIGMEKESIISTMTVYMKATFIRVTKVAMEYSSGQMELATMVSGSMT